MSICRQMPAWYTSRMKKYIAEFLGTFVLALLVGLSLVHGSPISTAPLAGLVLVFFVYTIGSISGCHINPAITLGLVSIKKISKKEAVRYIIAQFLAGFLALGVIDMLTGTGVNTMAIANTSLVVFLAEFFGTMLFAFGIASVVYGKVDSMLSGIMIGASLLLGICLAALIGSNGVLNPAVALGIRSFNLIYLFGPLAGSVVGMKLFAYLAHE